MAVNRTRLETRFQLATGCRAWQAKNHTQKYLKLCALAMLQDHFSAGSGSRYSIYLDDMRKALGKIEVNKKRISVLQTFDSFPERVFDYIAKGNNLQEKITMAQARYTLEDVILAGGTPAELAEEIYRPYQKEIDHQEFDVVDIDMRSLENYMRSNVSQERTDRMNTDLCEELDRNLKHAQRIWMLATAAGNQLIQVRSPSVFGRRYYQGPNLQNVPKIVRHAALGTCHEYDIESSVFAWKLSWFRAIGQESNTPAVAPATLELLDYKQAIRKRLAQTVFDTTADWAVKTIKEFITAIGFGAPMRGVGYVADGRYQKPALAQIITARNRLDRAMADAWVQEFVQEQRLMNNAIVALAQVNMLSELQQVPELWEKGGQKLKVNSVVSYLYQHAEREILDWAEQFCADREVILTVHDCIYTRRPVKLAEFKSGIQAFGEFFRLEHQEHRAWTWQDPVDISDPFYDPREAAVAKKQQQYHSSGAQDHWNGSGYDGTQEYDREDDPFFQEETE